MDDYKNEESNYWWTEDVIAADGMLFEMTKSPHTVEKLKEGVFGPLDVVGCVVADNELD